MPNNPNDDDLIDQGSDSGKADPISEMQAQNAKLADIYLVSRNIQSSVNYMGKEMKESKNILTRQQNNLNRLVDLESRQLDKLNQIQTLLSAWKTHSINSQGNPPNPPGGNPPPNPDDGNPPPPNPNDDQNQDQIPFNMSDVVHMLGSMLSTALEPYLGPFAPLVKKVIEDGIDTIAKYIEYSQSIFNTARNKLIEAAFAKYRQDLKDMASYQLDIYEKATDRIYSAWDKNLETINATQGYTKEQLNTLQDEVAKKLEEWGYQDAINAADFTDSLVNALNANLSGELAKVFATESLVLQKAIPEFDASAMADQFAAVWTKATKEGKKGEDVMVVAMEQIAGATRALRESTEGNNQFIKSIPAYFSQAQELVARAGGSVEQVAQLTTQMMAAEAPLAALAPQLSGFTGELVTILADQNNSTSVALRSIMHDLNSEIGVSATAFMQSFMADTQGTLETAFSAIQSFMDKNMNPGAQQEFYDAMSTLFGISSEKLAQIDFGYISEQLHNLSIISNTQALMDAEALMAAGETTTYEEQLVNNTANLLLAQNAVRDTLDNSLMRKLEKNEIQMEKLLYETKITHFVDFAETTMQFFVKMRDIIMTLRDPFGLTKYVQSMVAVTTSAIASARDYADVKGLSQVGSEYENSAIADEQTALNTLKGAQTLIKNAGDLYSTDTIANMVNTISKQTMRESKIDSAGIIRDKTEEQLAAEKASSEEEYQQRLLEAQELARQEAEEEKKLQLENNENLSKTATNTFSTSNLLSGISTGMTSVFSGISEGVKGVSDWASGWLKEQINLSWLPIAEDVSDVQKKWDWLKPAGESFIKTLNAKTTTMNDNLKSVESSVTNVKTSVENPLKTLVDRSGNNLDQMRSIGTSLTTIRNNQTTISNDNKNSVLQVDSHLQTLTSRYIEATDKNYEQLFFIQTSFDSWREEFQNWFGVYSDNESAFQIDRSTAQVSLNNIYSRNHSDLESLTKVADNSRERLLEISNASESIESMVKTTTGSDGILQKLWNDTQIIIGKGTAVGLPELKSALEELGSKLDTINSSIKDAAYSDANVISEIGGVTKAINEKQWTVVNNYTTYESSGGEAAQIMNS